QALRDGLRIVARVNDAAWTKRMTAAGATVAQSPYLSYGMTLAASAITPTVLDVHELPLLGLGTEEIAVTDHSPFAGKALRQILDEHPGTFIIGLRRQNQLRPWHDIEGPVAPGDVLVAL